MKTISEKILSAKSGRDARAGDIVVCGVDWVLGTDASSPMAIDYFEQMGGDAVRSRSRAVCHWITIRRRPRAKTAAFHERDPRVRAAHRDAAARGRRRHQPSRSCRSAARAAGRSRDRRRQPHRDLRRAEPVRHRRRIVGSRRGDAHRADRGCACRKRSRSCSTGARPRGVAAKDVALDARRRARCRRRELPGARVSRRGAAGADARGAPGARATWRSRWARRRRSSRRRRGTGLSGARADRAPFGCLGRSPTRATAREIVIDLAAVSPRDRASARAGQRGAASSRPPARRCRWCSSAPARAAACPTSTRRWRSCEAGGGRLAPGVQLVVTPASREVQLRLARRRHARASSRRWAPIDHDARLRRVLRHERRRFRRRDERAVDGEPQLQGAHGQRDGVDLPGVAGRVRGGRR